MVIEKTANKDKRLRTIKIVLGTLLLVTILVRGYLWRNFSSVLKTEKYKPYESENINLSFEHPAIWYIRERQYNPKVPNMCFIASQTEPYWVCFMYKAEVSDESRLTKYIEDENIGFVTNSNITGRESVEKDGEIWQKIVYNYEINRFFPFLHRDATCYISGVLRADGAYAIKFCSQKYALEEATPIFDRIFESLKIDE